MYYIILPSYLLFGVLWFILATFFAQLSCCIVIWLQDSKCSRCCKLLRVGNVEILPFNVHDSAIFVLCYLQFVMRLLAPATVVPSSLCRLLFSETNSPAAV